MNIQNVQVQCHVCQFSRIIRESPWYSTDSVQRKSCLIARGWWILLSGWWILFLNCLPGKRKFLKNSNHKRTVAHAITIAPWLISRSPQGAPNRLHKMAFWALLCHFFPQNSLYGFWDIFCTYLRSHWQKLLFSIFIITMMFTLVFTCKIPLHMKWTNLWGTLTCPSTNQINTENKT